MIGYIEREVSRNDLATEVAAAGLMAGLFFLTMSAIAEELGSYLSREESPFWESPEWEAPGPDKGWKRQVENGTPQEAEGASG